MGFFEKLFGGHKLDKSVICSVCGSPMYEDGENRYECSNRKCYGVSFREEDGEIVNSFARRSRGPAPACESCQWEMTGGVLIDRWEQGNNAHAFVTCPHCGHKNIQYGYGEDD